MTSGQPPRIDLNADLGEGFGAWSLGDDEAMLAVVTSANVACGFHAGDPSIMRTVCAAAVARDVVIGAQVSYPDLAGFGRRFIDIDPNELTDAVLYQIGALDILASTEGGAVRYVKPHGALYNAIVHHESQAAAVVAAIEDDGRRLPLLGLPGSLVVRLAMEAGLPVILEAFPDRGYLPDGSLVPRTEAGALVDDPEQVARRALRIVCCGEVDALDTTVARVAADTVCVHGDTPHAAAIARRVRDVLEEAGVQVRPFVQ